MPQDPQNAKPSLLTGQLTAQRSWVFARIQPIWEQVHTLQKENRALKKEIDSLTQRIADLEQTE